MPPYFYSWIDNHGHIICQLYIQTSHLKESGLSSRLETVCSFNPIQVHAVASLGLIFLRGAKIVAYPEVLQLFNDEIHPARTSVRNSLIKVAIYEIYGMKWGARPPKIYVLRPMAHCPLPRNAYECTRDSRDNLTLDIREDV